MAPKRKSKKSKKGSNHPGRSRLSGKDSISHPSFKGAVYSGRSHRVGGGIYSNSGLSPALNMATPAAVSQGVSQIEKYLESLNKATFKRDSEWHSGVTNAMKEMADDFRNTLSKNMEIDREQNLMRKEVRQEMENEKKREDEVFEMGRNTMKVEYETQEKLKKQTLAEYQQQQKEFEKSVQEGVKKELGTFERIRKMESERDALKTELSTTKTINEATSKIVESEKNLELKRVGMKHESEIAKLKLEGDKKMFNRDKEVWEKQMDSTNALRKLEDELKTTKHKMSNQQVDTASKQIQTVNHPKKMVTEQTVNINIDPPQVENPDTAMAPLFKRTRQERDFMNTNLVRFEGSKSVESVRSNVPKKMTRLHLEARKTDDAFSTVPIHTHVNPVPAQNQLFAVGQGYDRGHNGHGTAYTPEAALHTGVAYPAMIEEPGTTIVGEDEDDVTSQVSVRNY